VNIAAYISSGIIESYVLGLASADERTEFEELCRQYPELLKAREDFELALEKQAMENAIMPPADLKNKIFSQLSADAGRVLPIEKTPVKKMNWLKYAAAACLVLLAGSLYYNISLYNKNKKLASENAMSLSKLDNMEKDMRILQQNPAIKMAALKGLEASPQSFATVFWDTTSHDVYLMLNNLPKPASDKQYQLWALLDGKPIDMGLIDNDYFIKENRLLIKAKNIQHVQAFAITLEKKGRADTSIPQGDMYVLGNL
jgi:anti-sigma-K factor RskA